MKYCKNCGNELFDDAVMCPKCGTMQQEEAKTTIVQAQPSKAVPTQTENTIWGILALIFGILGTLGIIFGIVGLCMYKDVNDPNHNKNTTYCKVGIGLSILWIVILIILYATVFAVASDAMYA